MRDMRIVMKKERGIIVVYLMTSIWNWAQGTEKSNDKPW
jgi:hypothetical protein